MFCLEMNPKCKCALWCLHSHLNPLLSEVKIRVERERGAMKKESDWSCVECGGQGCRVGVSKWVRHSTGSGAAAVAAETLDSGGAATERHIIDWAPRRDDGEAGRHGYKRTPAAADRLSQQRPYLSTARADWSSSKPRITSTLVVLGDLFSCRKQLHSRWVRTRNIFVLKRLRYNPSPTVWVRAWSYVKLAFWNITRNDISRWLYSSGKRLIKLRRQLVVTREFGLFFF